MELMSSDYVVLVVTIGGGVIGLFIGFSGALGFLSGTVAAAAAGTYAYPYLVSQIPNGWARGMAELVGVLVVFGLVRLVVRKLVRGLVAQPGDSIFGALVSALAGAVCSLGAIWLLAFLTEEPIFDSNILKAIPCLPHFSSASL